MIQGLDLKSAISYQNKLNFGQFIINLDDGDDSFVREKLKYMTEKRPQIVASIEEC
jgi:hypothetical protein